jgi:hypothetical protein
VLQQGSDVQNVVITGHSMGAGVGTLLSYTMQVRLSWLLAMHDVDVASSRSAPYGDRSAEAGSQCHCTECHDQKYPAHKQSVDGWLS